MIGRKPDRTKGEITGTVFKKTAIKPLPAGARIIVDKADVLAEYLRLELVRRKET